MVAAATVVWSDSEFCVAGGAAGAVVATVDDISVLPERGRASLVRDFHLEE